MRVVGRAAPVSLFEPLGEAASVAPERLALGVRYEAALAAWRAGDATLAAERFAALAAAAPGDGPTAVLLARVRAAERPPAPDWDGVHDLPQK